MNEAKLKVGQVLGPVGLRGEVKVLSLTDFPDRFAPGARLGLRESEIKIERTGGGAGVSGSPLIVKFEGIDSREAAHRLSGAYLEVPAEAAHQLPSGAYYHYQLIGLRVSTESGRDLGVLEEVLGGPGNDIWVVKSHSGQHLVPALRSVVELVDLAKGTVLVKDWVLDSEEIRSGEADAV